MTTTNSRIMRKYRTIRAADDNRASSENRAVRVFKRDSSPLAQHLAYTGAPSTDFTVTFGHKPFKCRAPNWIKALNLGLRELCRDPNFDIDQIPLPIKIERK